MPPKAALPPDIVAFQECWNEGRFFEAHETLEPRWIEQRDRGLQGLIQLAAAFHHLRRGNQRGARSLLLRAIPRLRDPENAPCAIDQKCLAEFAETVQIRLDQESADELIAGRPRL